MTRLSLACLGPLHISLDEAPAAGFSYNKARALLVYLALEAEHAHARDALVGLLWPDLPETAARTNLRQALANLREAIGDHTAYPPFLLITRDTLQFNPASDHALDVAAFRARLAAGARHAHRHAHRCPWCAAQLEQALALYRGEFLAQFALGDSAPFEEWAAIERERLHQQAISALAQLAAYHTHRGDLAAAQRALSRQIELDPWREEAHRHLMRLLAAGGQRSVALAQYETVRRVLAEALSVAPAAETVALYEHIKAGAASSAPAPAPAPAAAPLPTETTPLIGREADLAELAERLADPACRLVSIVGLGGVGKTRLAVAAAAEQALTFEHGAAFVSLAALETGELLAPTLLAVLRLPRASQASPAEQLGAYLQPRELLLVLDNFEHLLTPQGEAVRQLAALLQQAPRLALLVTSRQRLGLQAEWVFDLEGLPTPPPGAAAPLTAEAARQYGAVRLFVERARQAQRHFTLAADVATVTRLCQLVEGLPLAIELAAARVRAYPVAVIAAEIETSLRATTPLLHDVPERHRSLWATFEYSWRLLTDDERRVFRRLAVFRGGFDAEAAAAVAGGTLALLDALVDQSLLRLVTPAAPGPARRYDQHVMVRHYAAQKLADAQELADAQRAHAENALALAEAAAPQLTGADQVAWLDRLEREHDNLRAALRWALDPGDAGNAETAGRLGVALWRFWWLHNHMVEGRGWLERLSLREAALSPAVLAGVCNGAGVLANDAGDHAAALAWHERGLALRRAMQDRLGIARSLGNLGNVAHQLGDKPLARERFTECLATFRELGHQWGVATTLLNLGVLLDDDALDEKTALYAESQALYRALGDQHGEAIVIGNLGEIALGQRAFPEARRLYGEYLILAQLLGNTPSVAHALMMLGIIALGENQAVRGVQSLGAAGKLRETTGVPVLTAWLPQYERYVTAARTALGQAAFDAAWAEGGAMPLALALQLAGRG